MVRTEKHLWHGLGPYSLTLQGRDRAHERFLFRSLDLVSRLKCINDLRAIQIVNR